MIKQTKQKDDNSQKQYKADKKIFYRNKRISNDAKKEKSVQNKSKHFY